MLFLAGTSALWKQGTSSRRRGKDMLHSAKLIAKVTLDDDCYDCCPTVTVLYPTAVRAHSPFPDASFNTAATR